MSIIDIATNLFTGGIAGGITGIVGSIASAITNYKIKKLQFQHEEKMQELNMQKMKVQIEVAKAKIEGNLKLAEQETLKESYKELNKSFFNQGYFNSLPEWVKPIIAITFAVLDFIRGIIRPLITIYILFLVSWIGFSTYSANPNAFTTSATLLVEVILYLATTIISWWFSDRSIQKFMQEKLK